MSKTKADISSEILAHSVSVEEARKQVLEMVHDYYHHTFGCKRLVNSEE